MELSSALLAEKYPRLFEIYDRLERQNTAIYQREQQRNKLEQELVGAKGLFKGKQKKDLQEQVDGLGKQIENMKQYL